MPSPFPGLDPYLESSAVWPDFHNAFASELRSILNQSLPNPYYAQLEVRTEITWSEAEVARVALPDVSVEHSTDITGGATAVDVENRVRTEISPSLELVIESEAVELSSVLIKDSRREHEVVTAIEIVSPANKRAGIDHDRYLAKRGEIVSSSTSLIEIDLLRDGERLGTEPQYAQQLARLSPPPTYLTAVGRSWQRGLTTRYQLFPIDLREALPVIAVPLREQEKEVPLDLQQVFRRTYDNGPYARGAVDYSQALEPALDNKDEEWASALVEKLAFQPKSQ